MVFYFTATGNCLYVAKELDGKRISIPQVPAGQHFKASSIGIVCPIFGHDIPSNVREFLQHTTFETEYFYVILTYGFCQGGASTRLAAFLHEMGMDAQYINVLKIVDNALPAFDIEHELAIDPEKKVDEHLAAIKADIAAHKQFIAQPTAWDIEYHKKFLEAPFKLDPEEDFRKKGTGYVSSDRCLCRVWHMREDLSSRLFCFIRRKSKTGNDALCCLSGMYPCLSAKSHTVHVP